MIKLVLAYCLLKEILRAYPCALGVLALFLAYQLYLLVAKPSVGMLVFVLLDLVIIWVVWREWRMLLRQKVV
ncbi:MAG: DUF2127 domain-containing protein [Candidatus Saccharimonadales bacterium]